MRLQSTRRPRRGDRHGFTLMEVLLVLAILVILGTFAVTNFGRVFAGAKRKAADSQLNLFKNPLVMYQMDIGIFPNNDQGLQALRVAPPDLANATKWTGPYLGNDIPKDPWENDYQYELIGPNSCRVFSAAEDGQIGTDDDIIKIVEG